jgi:alkylation response protein AidB-like acyl-CoA dehydrogenase
MTERTSRIVEGREDLIAWERSKPRNFFASDGNFQAVLRTRLGPRYAALEPELSRTGGLVATRGDELARLCNRDENLPVLRSWDGLGRRIDEVVFNAAHHELGAIFWGSGALAVLGEPQSELRSGALIYLLDHLGEAGHACPMACSAGLIKLLQRVGSEEQRRRYLPGLLERDYARRLYASQFVTEVQGGSDVGSNDCRAEPDPRRPGWYRLSGEKWFCSVIDAPLFVMTARVPGGKSGTAGLGLFLVPRQLDGELNGLAVRRLKYKLGTRSMASGEADFTGALAEPLGPIDQGFKNLIGIVLDTSRVQNAVAAAAAMRRAYLEAQTFATHRRAFGRRILEFPAVQRTLARMRVLGCAALASTFRILALTEKLAASPGRELADARRMHVNINKYGTAVACTDVVRSGIEVLGGNGTIEDFSVLPRLYRDSMVLESWEGTHNTLCAQILRDSSQRGLHRAWLAEVGTGLEALQRPELEEHRAIALRLHGEVRERLVRLLGNGPELAERHIRLVVDRMHVLASYLALLEELQAELERGPAAEKADLVEVYRRLQVEPVDPLESADLGELERRISARL